MNNSFVAYLLTINNNRSKSRAWNTGKSFDIGDALLVIPGILFSLLRAPRKSDKGFSCLGPLVSQFSQFPIRLVERTSRDVEETPLIENCEFCIECKMKLDERLGYNTLLRCGKRGEISKEDS